MGGEEVAAARPQHRRTLSLGGGWLDMGDACDHLLLVSAGFLCNFHMWPARGVVGFLEVVQCLILILSGSFGI